MLRYGIRKTLVKSKRLCPELIHALERFPCMWIKKYYPIFSVHNIPLSSNILNTHGSECICNQVLPYQLIFAKDLQHRQKGQK